METQTLEQIYFIGQTISAFAVVLSLIYVGLQIKQNTTATQTASAQAYVSSHNDNIGLINSSPNLANSLHQGANGLSALKGGELIGFMAFHDAIFISLQFSHSQWRRGMLEESLWATIQQTIVDSLKQKGQQEWWEMRRHWFNSEFQNYVDEAKTKESARPMHPGAAKG
jgi:hypothetical protein